jgi:hypothetical protein
MTKREHLKQELFDLCFDSIEKSHIDDIFEKQVTFSICQFQGVNIEDFEITFVILSNNITYDEDNPIINIEIYVTLQTRLLQEEIVPTEKKDNFVIHYDFNRDDEDKVINSIEDRIQKLTQWNSENTVEISILDLPYIPLKNPFTELESIKRMREHLKNPSIYPVRPIIPKEEPIILFDEDGNRIKY